MRILAAIYSVFLLTLMATITIFFGLIAFIYFKVRRFLSKDKNKATHDNDIIIIDTTAEEVDKHNNYNNDSTLK